MPRDSAAEGKNGHINRHLIYDTQTVGPIVVIFA